MLRENVPTISYMNTDTCHQPGHKACHQPGPAP